MPQRTFDAILLSWKLKCIISGSIYIDLVVNRSSLEHCLLDRCHRPCNMIITVWLIVGHNLCHTRTFVYLLSCCQVVITRHYPPTCLLCEYSEWWMPLEKWGRKAVFPRFGAELGPFFIGLPGNGIISILDAIASGDNSNFLSLRFFVVVLKPTVK